ncbi:Protein FAM200B [Takifugu flavidus]|uniref:Protein FAM200B n=1 Tax=Takifugu flavidus TaxID=433684 RepID=A0A5C6MGQ1_9TELE|nr:Protein FAM200B [Takifugu flavidus]
MASSLAVDESSDIRGDSSLNMTEEFLALRPVHGTTTGHDLYEEVSRCGNEMELPREKLVGWTTDGAAAMCGHRSGLVAKIREKMQEENVTAELTAHHCIIHLESLCAEALNMEHGMFTITHAVNFIRAKGLIQRQFKAFLSQWQTQRGDLPHHTEVRWLSQGKVLQRCFQLPEEIGCSWTAKGKTRLNSQTKGSCVKRLFCGTFRVI